MFTMKTQTLYTEGQPIKLGTRIGRGGEGEVFAVAGASDTLVKIYTLPDLRSREAKVRRMITADLANTTKFITFPVAPVRDGAGKFTGFTMRRIDKHQALHEVYPPGARKVAFPRWDYRFLVHAATNISRVVAVAHSAECVIGDVNHSSILIGDDAQAALIDADSFQIREGGKYHLCVVGVPEYTPPELQGQPLNTVVRTINHDAFGLAVVIFQLLWMGRHPFAGRYSGGEMSIEKAITEFRFAYSEMRTVGMQPPPAVPHLKFLPTPIGAAFEAAFGPEGVRERPTPKQWIALLTELGRSLRVCAANPIHYYPLSASNCPWCRMEGLQGIQLFIPPRPIFTTSPYTASPTADIAALWAAIEAVQEPQTGRGTPTLPKLDMQPSAAARNARKVDRLLKTSGIGCFVLAGLVVGFLPALWPLWLFLAGMGIAQLTRKPRTHADILRRAETAERTWLQALHNWEHPTSTGEFFKCKDALKQTRLELEGLPAEQQRRIAELASTRQSEQLRVYLERFQIRHHKISGIGPSKLQTLTSYGIETAADVVRARVLAVPGFGAVNSRPLLDWRSRLERRFSFNANPTPAEKAAEATIKADVARKALLLRNRLAGGPRELASIAAAAIQSRSQPDWRLEQAHRTRMQTMVDLQLLGLTMPTVQPPAVSAAAPLPRSPVQPLHGQSVRCPQCGSPMVTRIARRGTRAGRRFYGCSRYPSCRGTRPYP
jgi:DNA-binding helix-hairpin-helix protein with protein kinase domain